MIGDHDIMQTELATSRDGVHWNFWGDKPFYLAVEGKDSGRILLCYGLIRREDEIWHYARKQSSRDAGVLTENPSLNATIWHTGGDIS